MFTCSTLLMFSYPVPADIHGSVQHVTLLGLPVDVLPSLFLWFSHVKHFECSYINPPQVYRCAHVQCGWDVVFCTKLWEGGSCVWGAVWSADVCYMVSIQWSIVLTLSLLTQHIVYQLFWWVVHVSDQSCFFMQDGVRKRGVKFTEVEKTLSGMGRLDTLVLGIGRYVSLR